MEVPKEHQLECKGCGKTLDMRDASVLSHGWIEDGKIVCYDVDIDYSGSKKLDSPEFYTKEKATINLN